MHTSINKATTMTTSDHPKPRVQPYPFGRLPSEDPEAHAARITDYIDNTTVESQELFHQITQHDAGWGTDALKSVTFQAFLRAWTLPEPPLVAAKRARATAIEQGELPSEVDKLWPKNGSAEDKSKQRVYDLWASNTPLYSPKHIYDMLEDDTRTRYSSWRVVHRFPKLLTIQELYYLVETARKGGRIRLKERYKAGGGPLYDLRKFRHPFQPGELGGAVKSKVGKVYGTWLLGRCLSDSENTGGNANVFYEATCTACGFQREKLNYRSVSRGCPNCAQLATNQRGDSKLAAGALKSGINLWQMDDGGVTMQPDKPDGAVAKIRLEQYREVYFWESLTPPVELEEPPNERIVQATALGDSHQQSRQGDGEIDPDDILDKGDIPGF